MSQAVPTLGGDPSTRHPPGIVGAKNARVSALFVPISCLFVPDAG